MVRDSLNRIQSAPMRRRPINPLMVLGVLLALIIAALFLLSSMAKQQPIHLIETDVASATAAH